MRVAAWSLMLALLLPTLAGCLGDDPADDRDESDQERASAMTVPATMEFSGCQQFGVDFFADPAEVRPLLPSGFEPGGFPGVEATNATLFAYNPTCHATLDGTPVGEIEEFWLFAAIQPPGSVAHPEAFIHAYPLGIMTGSLQTAAAYRAWGIPRIHMETATSEATGPIGGGPFTMVADAANFSVEAEGALVPSPGAELSGTTHFRLVMAKPDGTITGTLDMVFGPYAVPAAGEAEVTNLVIDGMPVETQAYPGVACICGGEDWTWTMEFEPNPGPGN